MDITDSLAPASDQLDAIELVAGPRIFTIDHVTAGNADQPVNVHFADFPRPWRPSKGMRRVLAACWGADASAWIGRRVELFRDPNVTFGKDTPGGTRIRALSHIDGQKKVPLLVSRGKSAVFVVEPLADLPPAPSPLTDTEVDAQLENIAKASTTQDIDGIARSIGNRLPTHRVAEVKAAAKARRDTLTAVGEQAALDDTGSEA